MQEESFYKYVDSKYNDGLQLNKYKGTFSIASANEGQDGQIYLKWCYPQNKDRQPIDKSVPWQVKLGNKAEAIDILKFFLSELEETQDNGPGDDESEIPF